MRTVTRWLGAATGWLLAGSAHAEFVPTSSWRVAAEAGACVASAEFVSLPSDFFLGTVEYALRIDGARASLRERWIVPPVGWLFPDYEAAAERARRTPRTQAFAAQFGSAPATGGVAASAGMPPETEYPLGPAEPVLAAAMRAGSLTIRTPPAGVVSLRAEALPDVVRALKGCRAAIDAGKPFDSVVRTPAPPRAAGGSASPAAVATVVAARERIVDALDAGRAPDAAGVDWPGGVATVNALAALRVREDEAAEQTVLVALGVAIGRPQRSFLELMNAVTATGELLPPERLATIRSLLLAWAAARGARERGDDLLPDDRYRLPVVGETPAYAIAEQVFRWVDPVALRADALFDAVAARELGRAAFLRGRSLLRYGVLNSVDADLRYAVFELERARDASWLLRAMQAQATLLDAFGLHERARVLRASLRDGGALGDSAASGTAAAPASIPRSEVAVAHVATGWRAHLRRETLRPSSGLASADVEGAYTFFDRWFSTMGALALTSLLPADTRTSLRPGVESAGLDILLDTLQRTPKDAKEYASAFEFGLLEVQAATRGEVLGELASRAMLDPMAGERANVRDVTASRRAVAGEAWLRRERAKLRAGIAAAPAEPSAASAVRLQYLTTSFGARGVALVYDTAIGTADLQSIAAGSDAAIRNRMPTTTSRYAATIAGVQSGLGDRDALVVWYPAGAALHAFVVRRKSIDWVRTPVAREDVAQRVAAVRSSIESALNRVRSGAGVHLESFATADAAKLYALLVRPIEPHLANVDTLYVAPLGAIGGMPAAMLVESAGTGGTPPRWLSDRMAIVRMPALIDPRVFDRDRPRSTGTAIAFLGIGAPPADPPVVAGGSAQARLRDASVVGLPPLPNARSELASAARILGDRNVDRATLTGTAATRGAVFSRLRSTSPAVLMFATHGLLGGASGGPGEPALVIARDADDDGLLRMSDIVPLDLRSELVILSACATAPSGDDGAEPLAGLASAFLIAGARTVVASHWRVDTNVAETLTTSMLASMRERRMSVGAALRDAERDLRADPETAHPVFWAPFEVIGLPRAP